jgi:protein CpxP
MKKIMLICVFLLGIAAVSRAQGGQRRTPEERAKMLQTQLKLSDDQTAKITAIYTTMTKSVDSLRTAGADRAAFTPLMQAANDKVQAILTPDQAAAFQKIADERRARMQNGGGGN